MFTRTYKVKGEDVNDFMVMQNAAYLKYSSKIIDTFLFVNSFSNLKMNKLKVGLQKNNDQIKHHKDLMFTQIFNVQLKCKNIGFCNQKMNVEILFFNQKNELIATVIRELYWFDYSLWQTVAPPKTISKYFFNEEVFLNI